MLVLTLRQIGGTGLTAAVDAGQHDLTPIQLSPVVSGRERPACPRAPAAAASATEPLNLLDTDAGASLFYTNGGVWEHDALQ